MGFGKKMDYENSREVDLDRIYKKVIKDLFSKEFKEYDLIRADEISGSSLIDIGMYALLMNSDLVIADITTLNSNAIYELGVRHALRPFSTIIMADEKSKIPFDLNHSRFLTYKEIGESINEDDINLIKNTLKDFIKATENKDVDSPFYSFLPYIEPPSIKPENYKTIIKEAMSKSDSISKLIEQAISFRDNSDFLSSIHLWRKLIDLIPNNDYVVQQLALSIYKSKLPNESMALDKALEVIKSLNIYKSLDIETLGISGAIYKRMFKVNNNYDYLDSAIYFYKKGFIIQNDYYNGENYSICLLLKTRQSNLSIEEISYLKYESKMVQKEVVRIIQEELLKEDINFWMYATISVCMLCLGNREKHLLYKEKFLENCNFEWMKNSFIETINDITDLV